MAEMAFQQRQFAELDHYTDAVKREYVPNTDEIASTLLAEYRIRFGDELASRREEFLRDFKSRVDAELERNGFTPAKAAARTLELLGPRAAEYEKVIILEHMIKALRDCAAGKS